MNNPNTTPALVRYSGYAAIALLVLLPLSVLAVRSGAWQQGLLLYAVACLGSTALLILFIVLAMLPRHAGQRGAIAGRALFALPGTLLLLALTSGGDYPRIHDITTDTADPPLFVTAPAQRGPDANTLDIKPDAIAEQRRAYPDIGPLDSDLPPDEAFRRALQTAAELGWEVYHQDRAAGVIEAVATTRIMRFRDDVVIRLRPRDGGTRLDLRSVSRVGQGDIGANAKRIRAFTSAFGKPGG